MRFNSLRPLVQDIADSWTGLVRKPLRSLLSSLGIGIGVTALIAMLSISEGAQQATLKKIRSLGVDTLRIENRKRAGENASLSNLSSGLNLGDSNTLRAWLGERGVVGSYRRMDDITIHRNRYSSVGTVLGVDQEWFRAEQFATANGRSIRTIDIDRQERFCLVGSDMANELQARPGDFLTYRDQPLTVVGIGKPKGRLLTEGTGLASLNFDRTIYLPLTGIPQQFGGSELQPLDGIVIRLNHEKADAFEIGRQAVQLLEKRHKNVNDFEVVVPRLLLEEAKASQRTFSLIMGTIAGLSLIVGGIGVLNVMLANIAEQTREIGLRMAVGATRTRIVWLYLCHSMLLTLSGSIWGMAAGVAAALVIQHSAGWEIAFSGTSLILAPLSALVTGIIFGLHPAMRAASLDPARSLRET